MSNEYTAYTPWDARLAAHYRNQGYWAGLTLDHILRRSADAFADHRAIVDGDRSLSYRQLMLRVRQLAAGLQQQGVVPGDRVVVQLPNSIEFVEVVFALFMTGAIPVFALPAHRYHEISHFSEIADAKAYIGADRFSGFDYRELARRLVQEQALRIVVIRGEAAEFVNLESMYVEPVPMTGGDASALALLQLSGGTTNIPKLIPRTHDDYYYSVRASVEVCELTDRTVYLAALPMAHNFPLSSPGIFGVLYAGGCIVVATNPAPDTCFELIERHRVTMTSLVPPLAMVWMQAAGNNHRDLTSLQLIQVGGAKFGAQAAARLKQTFNGQLQQVFGMAEGLVNYTRLDDNDALVLNTQGRPMSVADEIRIVDDQDQPLPQGKTGQLLTRGPYTIRGYYRAAEHNRQSFTDDGFYRTGDVARLTEQGYLVVEGRVKDQINRGGEKIAAAEVENHLLAHALIRDAALVSMPDPFLGEKTCAFIVPDAAADSLPKAIELRRFLSERGLADYKIPDRFEFFRELPKTGFGKVNKQALRNILSDQRKQMQSA